MEFDFERLYGETRHEWEPKSARDWTEIDPMSRSLRRVEIEVSTTDQELISFQSAWMRCPPLMRAQILRERELAAALVEFLPAWRKRIPSLLSIGVGNRWPDRGLGAIVTVEQPLTSGEWFDVVNDWSQRRARKSLLPEFYNLPMLRFQYIQNCDLVQCYLDRYQLTIFYLEIPILFQPTLQLSKVETRSVQSRHRGFESLERSPAS